MTQALDLWLSIWRKRAKVDQHALGVRHVIIAVCDFFAPNFGDAPQEAQACITRWRDEFPQLAKEFRDADGAPPVQTFFYPIEQYEADLVAGLTDLCKSSGSEIEVSLHTKNGSAENLRRTLEEGTARLAGHGLLSRDGRGNLRYGCMHGSQALPHLHSGDRRSGDQNGLFVLRQTGCYAEFTPFLSPPDAKTHEVNALYYAGAGGDQNSCGHSRRLRAARKPELMPGNELLMVPSPLALNWQDRKFGVLPRIEYGDLSAANPPSRERLNRWLDCRISVENRPNWLFVKLLTQGAKPENTRMLLGEPMRAFHRMVAKIAAADGTIRFHYVTARELVNIVHAAEAGHSGEPGQFRDFCYRRSSTAPTPGSPVPQRSTT